MTMKNLFVVLGVIVLLFGVACTELAPASPTISVSGTTVGRATSTTYESPVVTLEPDLTANPSQVSVSEGNTIKMVNNSGRYVTIHSYNCSEFNMMNLRNGGWLYTEPFTPSGKTCDYFAWDVNWSRKIFQGQVTVTP